ncbi:RNA-binding cell elongation regulator Jag/EloR [uncultured Phascolarctobacterium sp.]|uniref:RNA-binding cell elongation regulator Jag/EloR n=1 Tax=uncultured Phascolarctobacterium sp. TaxID=512296 RepID=UPI00262C1B7F|nr:RNA-binding cell elongation regulator Jag/EloR [uncultured Phascolarctobacterium sp.]
MAFIEKKGKSVEEAVAEALKALNATRDQVEIEVLEESKKGFLGFFGKDAKVRVTVKEAAEAVKTAEAAAEKTFSEATSDVAKAVKEAATIAVSSVSKKTDEIKEQAADAAEELGKKAAAAKDQVVDSAISSLESLKSERPVREPRKYAVNDESVTAAKDFLQKVFNAMKIDVVMEKFINKNDGSVTFKLHGDDMGILIGKHGQTLDSLQYLTNLVANKTSAERVRVIIDVEDYRDRRIETLTRLAIRLADKVKRTGERVALEPMNPHERKIIHMALQGDRRVTTLSEGDDPYRHVVIELKK